MDHPAPDIRRAPQGAYFPAEDQYRLINAGVSDTPHGAAGRVAEELRKQRARYEQLREHGELTESEVQHLIGRAALSTVRDSNLDFLH